MRAGHALPRCGGRAKGEPPPAEEGNDKLRHCRTLMLTVALMKTAGEE